MPRPTPTLPTGPGHCPACWRPVLWTVTSANRVRQAVNPTPDPTGNVAVHKDVAGRWRSRQLSKDRPTPEGAEQLHMPHVATCPRQTRPSPRMTPTTTHRRSL